MRKLLVLILATAALAAPAYYFLISSHGEVSAKISAGNVADPSMPSPEIKNSSEKYRILFVGDMMFDRWIRQVSEKKGLGYIFEGINDMLTDADLVVGNLEGPITDKASVSLASDFGSRANYVFTFHPVTADTLHNQNIRLVHLGNNHILNQGSAGLTATKKYLQTAGVDYFGDPQSIKQRTFLKEVGEWRLAFVSYNQFMPNALDSTLTEIKYAKAQNADLILLYAHWGTEYASEPNGRIKDLAHQLVDQGADLIIGTHPHVIQPSENYHGKMIYYSLGNFIFDQYFQPETQDGLALAVGINPTDKTMDFEEIQVHMATSGQTIRQKSE